MSQQQTIHPVFRLELALIHHAGIAQLVEQLIRNEKVVGSTPIIGTKTLLYNIQQRLLLRRKPRKPGITAL